MSGDSPVSVLRAARWALVLFVVVPLSVVLPLLLTMAAVYVAAWGASSTCQPTVVVIAAGVAQLAAIVLPLALAVSYWEADARPFDWLARCFPAALFVGGAVVVNGLVAGSAIADSAACWGFWFPFAAFVSWVGAVALVHRVLDVRELRDLPGLLRGDADEH